MQGASSGPTNRALDVLELLARKPSTGMRYIDIVRALDLNQGTAHTILKTLVDRNWVSRDPDDKTFTLGPALAAVASKADQARPLVHVARTIAMELSEELGFAASVVELMGNELLISALYGGEQFGVTLPQPGLKVPYAPPYGAAFAAFAPAAERNAWLARRATQSQEVSDVLERALGLSRERGYDVDWTTPAVAQMAALVGSTEVHPSLLAAMDQILVEYTALAFDESDGDRPVTSITAAALDANGHRRLAIAVHPMRPIPLRRIQACGRRLVEEAKKIATAARPG